MSLYLISTLSHTTVCHVTKTTVGHRYSMTCKYQVPVQVQCTCMHMIHCLHSEV